MLLGSEYPDTGKNLLIVADIYTNSYLVQPLLVVHFNQVLMVTITGPRLPYYTCTTTMYLQWTHLEDDGKDGMLQIYLGMHYVSIKGLCQQSTTI